MFLSGPLGLTGLSEWDNPYLDRRLAYAMHVAVDRDLLIDAVYLGAAKPSGTHYCPWFSTYWTIPADELRTFPGYRIDREADIQLCRELIDASGFDTDRTVTIYIPDLWESTYPGISETTRNMYRKAVGFNLELDPQSYTVMQDRFDNKPFPGRAPTWTNPPADLDRTAQFGLALRVGGASNVTQYNYTPVEEIIDEMTVTLDTEKRRDMGRNVQRIGLGVDEGGGYPNSEHGLDGIFSWFGVMNGVVPTILVALRQPRRGHLAVRARLAQPRPDVARHESPAVPGVGRRDSMQHGLGVSLNLRAEPRDRCRALPPTAAC